MVLRVDGEDYVNLLDLLSRLSPGARAEVRKALQTNYRPPAVEVVGAGLLERMERSFQEVS